MKGITSLKREKIKIRRLSSKDLSKVEEFQDFFNSLIKEDAMIQANKKVTLNEERKWLIEKLKEIKKKRTLTLVAENRKKIVGIAEIKLDWGRQNHVGHYGIMVRKEYRRRGLGKCLTAEVLKLAKKELRPPPKIVRLSVYAENKPAIELYKKFGFREVARIPKQGKFQNKLVDEIIMLLDL